MERPKLVVGIVVDQMRTDYLYRFYHRFSDAGFKRLMREGTYCRNTYINYVPTFTAPGHASIYTGTVPAMHGITGNNWIDNPTGENIYCTQDDTAHTIGSSSNAGKMSPRNLLTTTITDELRMATNFRSRVYGISLKDRGAILPAGHTANGAFWYDDATGSFITSSYYMNVLPPWLNRFNQQKHPEVLLEKGWQLSAPLNTYTQSTFYQHELIKEAQENKTTVVTGEKGLKAIRTMPAGNTLALMLAKKCIEAEGLGNSGSTDFLALSLSSTDYIGHKYGPDAVEVEDTYIKLDKELGAFLNYLDKTIGKGNYLLFLTADHGAAHSVAYMEDKKLPAGLLSQGDIYKYLDSALTAQYHTDSLIRGVVNYQVVLNKQKIKQAKIDELDLTGFITSLCYQLPQMQEVVDVRDNKREGVCQELAASGYYPQRSGSLFLILKQGHYSGDNKNGTTHGSVHNYDTHIPLLWYGWHIGREEIPEKVHITDIAATLAYMLHIPTPSGSIGNVIQNTGIDDGPK